MSHHPDCTCFSVGEYTEVKPSTAMVPDRLIRQSLSVPKILTLFIPEILSRPAIAGRAKTLSVRPVGEPVGRREEDVRNVKASRSRDSTKGWSLQGRSGPSGGSVPVLC